MKNRFGKWTLLLALWTAAGIAGPVFAAEMNQTAVVVTASAGWSSGAHSIIRRDGGQWTLRNVGGETSLLPTISDLAVSAHRQFFYRIERFQSDNVAKFDVSAPNQPIWNVSAISPGELGLQSNSSNPFALVFASNEKAYLIRYGAKTAWIVDPSVSFENRTEFKIGELDLSAYSVEGGTRPYDDTDGYSEMANGVIVDGKLFIVMQRLVTWCPAETVHSYVAVFDVATDAEIQTGMGEGGLKGIALPFPVFNAGFPAYASIHYLEENHTIYVSGPASFGFCTSGLGGNGGVVAIDPDTYETEVVLDAGGNDWPHGSIFSTAIVSPAKGYFLGVPDAYDVSGSGNALKTFNPTTGAVTGDANFALNGKDLAHLALDRDGYLWICNSSDSKVQILDTADDSIEQEIATDLLPKIIDFVYTFDFEPGDVNRIDGITAQDAVDAFDLTQQSRWTWEELWAADFNGDGEVTAQDAVDIFWASF